MTADAVWQAWHDVGPAENWHRNAQDRLRRDWPILAGALDAMPAEVEGLRAELAERDAKIRAIAAAIHAEIRDPYAAAVAPSICEAVDEAVEVIEAATVLRAAGGQEKPSDPHPDDQEWTRDIPAEDHAAMVEAWQDRHPAAPVGGQAEPSAAQTCCDLHNRNCEPPSELCCQHCAEAHHGMHADKPGGPTLASHHDGSACIAPDLSSGPFCQTCGSELRSGLCGWCDPPAAAAVSGEQATPPTGEQR